MAVEVQQANDEEGRLPAETQAADNIDYIVTKPWDEAKLVQVGGHGNEGSKPCQRVPGCIVVQALLPGNNTCMMSGDIQTLSSNNDKLAVRDAHSGLRHSVTSKPHVCL